MLSAGGIEILKMKVAFIVWSLIFSIGCLVAGSGLAKRGDSTACIPFLQWSFISIGLLFLIGFILFVAVGFCGGEALFKKALICHLCLKCSGLLVFLCLIIFALVSIKIKFTGIPVTKQQLEFKDIGNIGDVDPVEVFRIHEFNLSDYGGSLRHRVADARYWAKISKCLRHRHACDGMSPMVRAPNTSLLLSEQDMSPIQSGCCKPPLSCAFMYVNQTMWTPTHGAPTNNTDDCGRWSNDQQTLCFQCDSCKAAVLADIQRA